MRETARRLMMVKLLKLIQARIEEGLQAELSDFVAHRHANELNDDLKTILKLPPAEFDKRALGIIEGKERT